MPNKLLAGSSPFDRVPPLSSIFSVSDVTVTPLMFGRHCLVSLRQSAPREDEVRILAENIAYTYPAEIDGFFQDIKILSTSPPGGTLSWRSRI